MTSVGHVLRLNGSVEQIPSFQEITSKMPEVAWEMYKHIHDIVELYSLFF